MLIDLHARPADRQLRWFAGLWFPAMCAMLGWFAFRQGASAWAYAIWIGGGVLGAIGLIAPRAIAPVYGALIVVTFPIGWVLSHVILRVMYYLVITPIGLIVGLFHDPLNRRFDREASSYWEAREPSAASRYFRQF